MACRKNHDDIQPVTDGMPVDQGGAGLHKSPHAAYAAGYLEGVKKSYGM